MPTDEILLSDDSDNVRTITLNRPAAYNSLTIQLKEQLLDTLRDAATDANIRAVVLTGAGKAFCAGQDLKEHVELLQSGDSAPLRTVSEHYNPIVRTIIEMPKPVIAAVNGAAAGAGAALAYASDLRVTANSASFSMAFAGVGLGPDTGASWTLQRLIGYGRTTELMLSGRKVDTTEALRIGLVNEAVADQDLPDRVRELATSLAAGPTAAYARIKEVLGVAAGGTLEAALAAEETAQAALGATTDHAEAVEAFVAKRKPNFTGA